MSDQERADAAARVLADAVTSMAAELTGNATGDILLALRVTIDSDLISYTWDWFWRPKGSVGTPGGMAAAPRSGRASRGLHAPQPRVSP